MSSPRGAAVSPAHKAPLIAGLAAIHGGFMVVALIAMSPLPIAQDLSYAFVFVVDSQLRSSVVLEGALPYRDFPFEYPPLGLLPILLPRVAILRSGQDLAGYALGYAAQSMVASITLVLLLAYWLRASATAPTRGLALYGVGVAILLPFIPFRFDLLPALATAAALILVQSGKPGSAGMAIGLGGALKLYPLLLVPVLGLVWLLTGRWRSLARFGGGLLVVIALAIVPFILIAPAGWTMFIDYYRERGLEVGSAAAGVIALARVSGLYSDPLTTRAGYDSYQVESGLSDAVLPLLPALTVITLLLVYGLAARQFHREAAALGSVRPASLLRYALAVLLAALLSGKVLSPQFMAWLLPFVPFLSVPAAVALLAAFALTTAIFPFGIEALNALQPAAVLALDLRNLLLAGLLAWVLRSPGVVELPDPLG